MQNLRANAVYAVQGRAATVHVRRIAGSNSKCMQIVPLAVRQVEPMYQYSFSAAGCGVSTKMDSCTSVSFYIRSESQWPSSSTAFVPRNGKGIKSGEGTVCYVRVWVLFVCMRCSCFIRMQHLLKHVLLHVWRFGPEPLSKELWKLRGPSVVWGLEFSAPCSLIQV